MLMEKNQDTLFCHWYLLRLSQRNLQVLSALFALVVDNRDKPFGWSWKKLQLYRYFVYNFIWTQ